MWFFLDFPTTKKTISSSINGMSISAIALFEFISVQFEFGPF
jgi:hypothetical protein